MRCIHYQVTWDKDRPKGCKLYGFKSKSFPSVLVKAETGEECLGYKEKARPKKNKGLDLNDDSLW